MDIDKINICVKNCGMNRENFSVTETFKDFTPKLTLKIRCLICGKCYIGIRFVV